MKIDYHKVLYLKTDAALLLYSSNLVNVRYDADHYRINAKYTHPNKIVVSGYFQYIKVYQNDPIMEIMRGMIYR